MKPQDLIFFVVLIVLIFFRKTNWMVVTGLICLGVSIPLFAKHIFFTAEHLTYYAGGLFLVGIIFKLFLEF